MVKISVAALLVLTSVSCGGASDGGSSHPSAAATGGPTVALAPAEALAAAARKLGETPVQVSIATGGVSDPSATGRVSPGTGRSQLTFHLFDRGRITTTLVVIQNVAYVQTDAPGSSEFWMSTPPAKLAGIFGFFSSPDDPAGAARILGAARDVRRDGDLTFAGTLDLAELKLVGASGRALFDAGGKPVPFSAEVDAEGRLTLLTVDTGHFVGASTGGPLKISFYDFGKAVQIDAPPSHLVRPAAG